MKIKKTNEILSFLQRCQYNMMNDEINDYLSVIFDPSEEKEIQEELHEIGAIEFLNDKRSTWPSLYISSDEYSKTPYQNNIKLTDIQSDGFHYEIFEMGANELINVDVIQDDPNQELNDSLILKAFDKPFKTAILKQDDEMWMSDTPQEANTINPYAKKAQGHVLTFGLGIGYFVYMALINDNVELVTVIERSESLIQMFKKYLLPQFPHPEKVKLICSDAYLYYTKENIDQYDTVFVDIHKSNDDGFEVIEKMLEIYNPPLDKINFWIEETCVEFIRGLMVNYFQITVYHQSCPPLTPLYNRLYKKIETYFNSIDKTLTTVQELKDLIYSKQTLRNIIAINLK